MGGKILLRGMTGGELVEFQQKVAEGARKKTNGQNWEFPAKLLVRCIINDEGERVLEDEDWQAAQQWPGSVFQKLVSVAMRLNGFSLGAGESPLPETDSDDSSSD
jgi:hypothetical protein